jgi:hypothetical protein
MGEAISYLRDSVSVGDVDVLLLFANS